MLTEIGKFLRRYRIDNGLLLKDMAGKVGVTSAYLSAVENGKKRPTEDLVGKIINAYDLDSEKATELNEAYFRSVNEISISTAGYSTEQTNLGLIFARKIDSLTSDEINSLIKILDSKR